VERREKLSRVFLHSIRIFNFYISLGRVAFDGILMLTWGTLGRKFDVNLGELHERHAVQVEFGYQLSICSRTEVNLDCVGRSQDLPNAYDF
jgi:hypothetical protein